MVDADALSHALDRVWHSAGADKGMDALNCVRLHSLGDTGLMAEAMNGYQYQNAVVARSVEASAGWSNALPLEGILLRRADASRLVTVLRSGFLGDTVLAHVVMKERAGKPSRPDDGDVAEQVPALIPSRLFLCGTKGTISFVLPAYCYPNTALFLDKLRDAKNTLTASAGELCSALRLLAVLTSSANRAVYIDLAPEEAVLSVTSCDLSGSFALDADCQGPLKRIAFPLSNLLTLARRFKKDEHLLFTMLSDEGPCLITGDQHPAEGTVIMPMKILDDDFRREVAHAG